MNMRVWVGALRLKTLGASLCPVLIGAALAKHDGVFVLTPIVLAFAGACLLQIASNFANDLYDGVRGTDSGDRLGPTRAVGSGLITPRAMRNALIFVLILAAIPAFFLTKRSGAIFAMIGVVGAISAVAYTAPPIALAYRGLGDLFVFAFFGPIAVAGTRAACDGAWTTTALLCGIGSGAIAVCLLATNNLRDRVLDAANGKRTLAVRSGQRSARAQIGACHLLALATPMIAWRCCALPASVMLATLVALFATPATITILRGRDGAALNGNLAMFGALLYCYGAAFAVGSWFDGGVA